MQCLKSYIIIIISRIWKFARWKYDMKRFVVTPCYDYLQMSRGGFEKNCWFQLDALISMLWSSSGESFLQKTIRASMVLPQTFPYNNNNNGRCNKNLTCMILTLSALWISVSLVSFLRSEATLCSRCLRCLLYSRCMSASTLADSTYQSISNC